MFYSKHAESRFQQRGIPFDIVGIIYSLGEPGRLPGDVTEWHLSNKEIEELVREAKVLIKKLQKAKKKVIVVSNDERETVITGYHRIHKKHRRKGKKFRPIREIVDPAVARAIASKQGIIDN